MIDYGKILNTTVTEIKPSGIRKFFDIAETMEDVISLGVGEPDFQTPWRIRKAGINSLERGKTKYSANKGLNVLRAEISRYLDRKYNLKYNPQTEILVTVGGSEAIDGAIRAIVNFGDEVIIPQPSYVCYEPITRLAGGVPVIIETKAENDFKVTPEELKNVSIKDYRDLGAGFRDKYLYQTVQDVLKGNIDLNKLHAEDTEKVKKELLKLQGVGPKVADCILLFSTLKRFEVFPIDVWVRRVMNELYINKDKEEDVNKKEINELAEKKFGNIAGLAQQYLFYWKRETA